MNNPVLIRAVGLFLPIIALWILWIWRRPDSRAVGGVMLASLWATPTLLALHMLAARFDWWRFEVDGGVFLGVPVDLYLGWVLIWGAIPALAFPRVNLIIVAAVMMVLDIVLMSAAAPIVVLGDHWLIGEVLGLGLVMLPAQLLARWTATDRHLGARATIVAVGYSALVFWMLPSIILELTAGEWRPFLARPLWINSIGLQLLALPAIFGLTAVQEFIVRGDGTPIPLDPPKRVVTSGVYGYLANPMQLSTALILVGWGLLLESLWVVGAGAVSLLFSIGLAAWSEDGDLTERFGEAWRDYRKNVRGWWPRWRPWYPSETGGQPPQARLYISEECAPCSALGRWLIIRRSVALTLVAAEDHPCRDLTRLTYEPLDGTTPEEGVAALARALEHIHLGWAICGWAMRLPVIVIILQLIVDAVGGGPRKIVRKNHYEKPRASKFKKIRS